MGARWFKASVGACLAVFVLGAPPAFAANLTLTTGSLLGLDVAAAPDVPTVLACDNFRGTTGANLNGRAVQETSACGTKAWSVRRGAWSIQGNTAATGSTAATFPRAVLRGVGRNVSVELTLTTSTVQAGQHTGIVFLHNTTNNRFLTAEMTWNGTSFVLELRSHTSATAHTVLASTTFTQYATTKMRVSFDGSQVWVSVDGSNLLNYNLGVVNPALLATLTGSDVGIIGSQNSLNGASYRYDDLLVTTVVTP